MVAEQTVISGGSVEFAVEVVRPTRYAGPVDLRVDSSPTGLKASLAPNPTSGNATLVVVADPTAATGDYFVRFSGRAGTVVRAAFVKVNVQANKDLQLLVSPSFLAMSPGLATTGTVRAAVAGNPDAPVTLTAEGLPDAAAMVFSKYDPAAGSTFTLATRVSFNSGVFDFQIVATSGAVRAVYPMRLVAIAERYVVFSADQRRVFLPANGVVEVPTNVHYAVNYPAIVTWENLPPGVQAKTYQDVTTFQMVDAVPGTYVVNARTTYLGFFRPATIPLEIVIG